MKDFTCVLNIHNHRGKDGKIKKRLLYLPTRLHKMIPENAEMLEVEIIRVLA